MIGCEFVVAAAELLYERVLGDDHLPAWPPDGDAARELRAHRPLSLAGRHA